MCVSGPDSTMLLMADALQEYGVMFIAISQYFL